ETFEETVVGGPERVGEDRGEFATLGGELEDRGAAILGMRPTTDDAALLERDDRAAHGGLRAPGVPNDLLRGGGPRREMDDHRHVVAGEPVTILNRDVDRSQVAVGDLEEPQSDPFA